MLTFLSCAMTGSRGSPCASISNKEYSNCRGLKGFQNLTVQDRRLRMSIAFLCCPVYLHHEYSVFVNSTQTIPWTNSFEVDFIVGSPLSYVEWDVDYAPIVTRYKSALINSCFACTLFRKVNEKPTIHEVSARHTQWTINPSTLGNRKTWWSSSQTW